MAQVIDVGEYAFFFSGIEAVAWPRRAMTIPEGCFSDCYSLAVVTNLNAVMVVGPEAFALASALPHMYLPPECNVTSGTSFFETAGYSTEQHMFYGTHEPQHQLLTRGDDQLLYGELFNSSNALGATGQPSNSALPWLIFVVSTIAMILLVVVGLLHKWRGRFTLRPQERFARKLAKPGKPTTATLKNTREGTPGVASPRFVAQSRRSRRALIDPKVPHNWPWPIGSARLAVRSPRSTPLGYEVAMSPTRTRVGMLTHTPVSAMEPEYENRL